MKDRTTHKWLWWALGLLAGIIVIGGIAVFTGVADSSAVIIQSIRGPRIVMAIAVGAGLAAAGVLLQGSLRNPLADPALVGISAGAALGSVLAATVGISFATLGSAAAATVGAAGATALVVWASVREGRPEVVTLLLAGVAVSAFAAAVVAMLVSAVPSASTRPLSFWTSGSLALSTWNGVIAVLPFVAAGMAVAATVSTRLDVLALGDRDAAASGVDPARLRWAALSAVVLLVGAGVAVVGVIAFLGLVVPHAMRVLIGPRNGPLLVVSSLAGAMILLLADLAARSIAQPVELPVGAVTAIIGAPVFFVLMRRTRVRQGGWA
jgi:iron complex transport system permease protein